MKRERLTQIVLVIVGLLNLAIIYSCIRTCGIPAGFWIGRMRSSRCF
jgi:hypothetical protein